MDGLLCWCYVGDLSGGCVGWSDYPGKNTAGLDLEVVVIVIKDLRRKEHFQGTLAEWEFNVCRTAVQSFGEERLEGISN